MRMFTEILAAMVEKEDLQDPLKVRRRVAVALALWEKHRPARQLLVLRAMVVMVKFLLLQVFRCVTLEEVVVDIRLA